VIAAAAVLALGVAAADAWIIGKTLSSHMNEYRHVGELSETIIEAEARRQATRRAAARYHRIKKEAE